MTQAMHIKVVPSSETGDIVVEDMEMTIYDLKNVISHATGIPSDILVVRSGRHVLPEERNLSQIYSKYGSSRLEAIAAMHGGACAGCGCKLCGTGADCRCEIM
mmetsp:Transcript_26657/g.44590  ORF Transcript_26657/g.44590 Transcript_26657/m.44590 type:complete len:103 (+) Transcript_26657:292-600(+)